MSFHFLSVVLMKIEIFSSIFSFRFTSSRVGCGLLDMLFLFSCDLDGFVV